VVVVELRPRAPYMISKHIEMFTVPGRPTPCIYTSRRCRRALHDMVYEVSIEGEPDNPLLRIEILHGHTTRVLEVVRHVYNIELDYTEFLVCVEGRPRLRTLAARYRGLRPALAPSIFEALIKNIVAQNISQRLALRIVASMVETLGRRIEISNRVFYDFPSPEDIARVDTELLRRLGMGSRKAEYIKQIATEVARGLDIESLQRMDPLEAVKELTKLKGVGIWTAKLTIMQVTGKLVLELFEDRAVKKGAEMLCISEDDVKHLRSECPSYLGLVMYLLALEYEERRV